MKTFVLTLGLLGLAVLLAGCATDSTTHTPTSGAASHLESPNSSGTELHGSISVGAGTSF